MWNNRLNMLKCMENRQNWLWFPSREFPTKKWGASTKHWRVPRLHKCDQMRPDCADRLNARNFWDLNVVRSDSIRSECFFFAHRLNGPIFRWNPSKFTAILMRSSQSDTSIIHSTCSRLQWTIVLDHTIGYRRYQCCLLCSSSKKFTWKCNYDNV
jgi:hypothetical protein